jgi:hypothetical protein
LPAGFSPYWWSLHCGENTLIFLVSL